LEGISSNCYPYTVSTLVAPLSTKTYTYATTGWKDLLVSYDGQTITYDVLGNPLNYRGHTLTWGKGKQLESYDNHTFAYDASGMRIRKDGITYEYDGKNLLREIRPTGTIQYLYDASSICGFNYGGVNYYYQNNLQGDVTSVYDENGNLKAEYIYDAWGKCTVTVDIDGIGTLNPIRYRGYYYDSETALYYVKSRYYDPGIGRWINADGVIAGVGGDVKVYNLFVYCFNNPVNMDDQTGNWPKWIKNTVKWVAKNIVKPVVKTVQKALSKVDLTYSTGVNVSGTPSAWIFNGQIGVSMDTKGNVAIQASGGGGVTVGTPSISISVYGSMTNAPSINELNGTGYQIGGSSIILVEGVPMVVGGDFNIIPDLERNKTYYGGTLIGGLAVGKPGGEFHVEWGTTVTLPKTQFNIYDVAKSVYIKIMEW